MKIAFFGTPDFSRVVLDTLLKAHQVRPDLIVTNPDKPRGRGLKVTPAPAALWAKAHDIPLFQPTKLDATALEFIKKFKPDVGILAAYGKLVPDTIISAFPKGIINIHPSLLPRYRGATPIESAILNGDLRTGVSLMLLAKQLDAGPVLKQTEVDILPQETAPALAVRLAITAAHDLAAILPQWLNNQVKAIPQDDSKATFTKLIQKSDLIINAQKSAQELERQVRAFYPKTALNITYKNQPLRLNILEAAVAPSSQKPGQFFTHNNLPALSTSKDALILKTLQPPGKKPMPGEAFLRGHNVGLVSS